EEPTPHVDWTTGDIALLAEPREWPRSDEPRRAAVSSFGISGTNAHLILEHAPAQAEEPRPVAAGPVLWPISAKNDAALRAQAVRLRRRPDADPPPDLADIGYSLAATHAALGHRAVIIGAEREEFRAGLAALAAGREAPGLVTGVAGRPGTVAFAFTGQG